MSPRDSFWFLAGVLVAVAIMVTVRAWLRERPALGEAPAEGGAKRPPIPSFAVPVAAGLALVGVALGIYFLLGSPDSIALRARLGVQLHGRPTTRRWGSSPHQLPDLWTTSQTSWRPAWPRRVARTTTGSSWRSRTSTWAGRPKPRRPERTCASAAPVAAASRRAQPPGRPPATRSPTSPTHFDKRRTL